MSVLPYLFLPTVVILDYLVERGNAIRRGLGKGLGICYGLLVVTCATRTLLRHDLGGESIPFYMMARELNKLVPESSVVGAWNAGVFGYFFERGSVVNLDGLVNNDLYPYLKQRDIGTYVASRGISYIVDAKSSLEVVGSHFWGKNGLPSSRRKIFAMPGRNEEIALWKIR
jgi:hypothetical protein